MENNIDMILITEESRKFNGETIHFVRVFRQSVQDDVSDDERVFYDGEENCLYTHLLKLGLSPREIELQLTIFKNVKL